MKYTSLLCAAVVATALGAYAKDGATTVVASATFDGADAGPITNSNVLASLENLEKGTRWTAQPEDESAIISAPISMTEDLAGYSGKSLLLNTQGQELSVSAGTQPSTKSEIKMKVRLVASDSFPSVTENDVHAAVFLLEEENGPTNGLYALSWDATLNNNDGGNTWVQLTGTNLNNVAVTVTNGASVALKVVMDYADMTATYAAFALGDDPDQEVDNADYIELGTNSMSFAQNDQIKYLRSVAFKGTGSVDDLFISSIEQKDTSATIVFNLYVDGNLNSELATQDTIDVEEFSANFLAFDPTDYGDASYDILSVDIWDGATNLVVQLVPAALYDGNSDYFITSAYLASLTPPVALEAGHSYEVRVMVGSTAAPSAYTGATSGGVTILATNDVSNANQQQLEFTGITVAGNTVTATFTAAIAVADGASTANLPFGIVYKTALSAAEPSTAADAATVAITFENDVPVGGTATITLPQGVTDSFFLLGFGDAAPAGD